MKLILFIIFIFPALASGAPLVSKIQSNGHERQFILHKPKNINQNKKHPLLIVFHGGGGTAKKMMDVSGFNIVADRENFFVVYPNAYKKNWNDGRETTAKGVDDVSFVHQLIDYLASKYPIDNRRVFASGISNGGFFTQRLACESHRFAGFASVVSTMAEALLPKCHPKGPVNILMINGREDRFVPWQGGEVKKGMFSGKGGKIVSVNKMQSFWLLHNQCKPEDARALPDTDKNDEAQVFKSEYRRCASGARVDFYDIKGGGHMWPGYKLRFFGRKLLGNNSMDIIASEEIWRFFSK